MTIQKKSLINSLSTTKKALVATSPATGSAATGKVKAGKPTPATLRMGKPAPATLKLAKPTPARIALGKKF